MSEGHYTSKQWHIIPCGDGTFNIRHDSSYATSGVSELKFDPRDYGSCPCGNVRNRADNTRSFCPHCNGIDAKGKS